MIIHAYPEGSKITAKQAKKVLRQKMYVDVFWNGIKPIRNKISRLKIFMPDSKKGVRFLKPLRIT